MLPSKMGDKEYILFITMITKILRSYPDLFSDFDMSFFSGQNDSYSLIAMGNVWLQNLQQPSKDKAKVCLQ